MTHHSLKGEWESNLPRETGNGCLGERGDLLGESMLDKAALLGVTIRGSMFSCCSRIFLEAAPDLELLRLPAENKSACVLMDDKHAPAINLKLLAETGPIGEGTTCQPHVE
jgi:hypothetical protein